MNYWIYIFFLTYSTGFAQGNPLLGGWVLRNTLADSGKIPFANETIPVDTIWFSENTLVHKFEVVHEQTDSLVLMTLTGKYTFEKGKLRLHEMSDLYGEVQKDYSNITFKMKFKRGDLVLNIYVPDVFGKNIEISSYYSRLK